MKEFGRTSFLMVISLARLAWSDVDAAGPGTDTSPTAEAAAVLPVKPRVSGRAEFVVPHAATIGTTSKASRDAALGDHVRNERTITPRGLWWRASDGDTLSGYEEMCSVFITTMVAAIGHRIRLNPRRLYATGMSNGGMMAYRLACDTRIFAAIGPVSATLLGGCPAPPSISVIHIHGTADHHVPYNGGQGIGPGHINGPSIPSVIVGWRKVDHCASPRVTKRPRVTTSVAACPDVRAVELITIQDAGRQCRALPRTR